MARARLIVDGMNVIGSRPDRWWRDRPAAMRRLVDSLEAYARETGDEVTVVLDAEPFEVGVAKARRLGVVFARPTVPNAGDDEIVRLLERDPAPESVQVVTSDTELARRVAALGATVTPAGSFRSRLDRFEAPGRD